MSTEVDVQLAKYRSLQADVQSLYSAKQQTLSQFNENTLVQEELSLLPAAAVVYKLVGPVLMTVDLEEAKENVGKRLEFIVAEMTKADTAISIKQGEQTEIGEKVSRMQQKMQEEASMAVRQIVNEQTHGK